MDKGLLQPVTIETFVYEIMKQYVKNEQAARDFVTYGYDAGWLEESDVLGRDSLLERKTAARIVHQFMRTELREADEDNTSAAHKLQDLYDCRSCVGHVMQVYTKGIMDGYVDHAGAYIFGMRDKLSEKEAREIVSRLLGVQNRKVQISESDENQNAEMISLEEALHYLHTNKNVQIVDVRTKYEFSENHMEGAMSLPLSAILKNPYAVSSRRDQMILLYCKEGYQSEIAANCLIDAGYENVMYFAWELTD